MERKYIVTYASGATGFGWEHEYDRISELEGFVNEIQAKFLIKIIVKCGAEVAGTTGEGHTELGIFVKHRKPPVYR